MIIDFIGRWAPRTELPAVQLVGWIGLSRSKFYDWRQRYGQANEHNGLVPRDHWLEATEKKAILDFHAQYPLEGYRRLTFMMLDGDLVAVSPSSTYRVLKAAGRLDGWQPKPSKKGTGFAQPLQPHERWHRSLKSDCLRPGTPLCLDDARRLVTNFVAHYNTVRLHSAIGYVTPADKLANRDKAIFAARDQKLHQARENRKTKRQQLHSHSLNSSPHSSN